MEVEHGRGIGRKGEHGGIKIMSPKKMAPKEVGDGHEQELDKGVRRS